MRVLHKRLLVNEPWCITRVLAAITGNRRQGLLPTDPIKVGRIGNKLGFGQKNDPEKTG